MGILRALNDKYDWLGKDVDLTAEKLAELGFDIHKMWNVMMKTIDDGGKDV